MSEHEGPPAGHPASALDDLASALAQELGEVSVSVDGAVTTFTRGDASFARASTGEIEVRLPDDIGEAALRTAHTSVVPGERSWILFAPETVDPHAADRAQAWFRTAWRYAARR